MTNVGTDILDEFGSGENLRLMKLEKTMLMELLDRMRTDLRDSYTWLRKEQNIPCLEYSTPHSCSSHQEFTGENDDQCFQTVLDVKTRFACIVRS